MQTQKIEYTNGTTKLIGYLAFDESVTIRRPGVVLFPEAFGLNDHARERAQRLATLGYIALAADINGEGRVIEDLAKLASVMKPLAEDRHEWRSRARAALDTLATHPQVDTARMAAIGFCFGGTTALELARSGAALKAITTFHAGLMPGLPEDAGRIQASVLICHGADDPLVKRETLDAVTAELRRDRTDWQLNYYGNTVHSFTEPAAEQRNNAAFAHSPTAERRSWAAMRAQFDEAFV